MKQAIDIKYDAPTNIKIAMKGFMLSAAGATSCEFGFPNLAI